MPAFTALIRAEIQKWGAVARAATETGPIFAEAWHTDWSFQKAPPAGTCLYGLIIPPVGGDTLFANQYAAWDALSPAMQALLKDKLGVHSARMDMGNRDRVQDESLGLNCAWYADILLTLTQESAARPIP